MEFESYGMVYLHFISVGKQVDKLGWNNVLQIKLLSFGGRLAIGL